MRAAMMIVALTSLIGLVGCGDDKGLISVSGVVTLDGVPVHDASVTFAPTEASGTAASGTTDDSGRFSLSSNGTDRGCKPGKYKVTVLTFENKKTHSVGMAESMSEKFKSGGNVADASKTAKSLQKDINKAGAKKSPLLTPAIYADTEKTPVNG